MKIHKNIKTYLTKEEKIQRMSTQKKITSNNE